MKVTAKRQPSNTARSAVRAAQNAAQGPIAPPEYLTIREGDKAFWDAIVQARARDTWTDSDLALAAQLARAQADAERLQRELDAEGDVTADGRLNPKHRLLETLSKRAISLSRLLHVHAAASVGKSEDAAKALHGERAARAGLQALGDDELIPRLRVA